MPRPKENRETLRAQVTKGNTEIIQEIARKLGYVYADKGSQGALIDAICCGEVLLVKKELTE